MIQQRNAVRATDEPLSTSRDRRVAIFKRISLATVTWYRIEMPETYNEWVADMDAYNKQQCEIMDNWQYEESPIPWDEVGYMLVVYGIVLALVVALFIVSHMSGVR